MSASSPSAPTRSSTSTALLASSASAALGPGLPTPRWPSGIGMASTEPTIAMLSSQIIAGSQITLTASASTAGVEVDLLEPVLRKASVAAAPKSQPSLKPKPTSTPSPSSQESSFNTSAAEPGENPCRTSTPNLRLTLPRVSAIPCQSRDAGAAGVRLARQDRHFIPKKPLCTAEEWCPSQAEWIVGTAPALNSAALFKTV